MVAEFILDASGNKQIEGTAEFEKAKKLLLLTCIYYVMENEKEQTLAKVKEIVQNFLDPDKMCESPAFLEGATAAYYKHFLAIDTDIRYGAIISVYFHMLSFLSKYKSCYRYFYSFYILHERWKGCIFIY